MDAAVHLLVAALTGVGLNLIVLRVLSRPLDAFRLVLMTPLAGLLLGRYAVARRLAQFIVASHPEGKP